MSRRGVFLSLEGPEGSGKTTQASRLAAHLEARGYPVELLREPGSTPIGEAIRQVLHSPANREMRPETEFLLFSAARAQLVRQRILPALEAGRVVLADRFADSSLAYQGHGRGLNLEALRAVTALATGSLVPDLTFYLDLPVEVGLARKQRAHQAGLVEWNRLDAEATEFHRRVREGYLAMAAAEAERWVVIDATRSEEAVLESLIGALEARSLLPEPQSAGRGMGS